MHTEDPGLPSGVLECPRINVGYGGGGGWDDQGQLLAGRVPSLCTVDFITFALCLCDRQPANH